MTEPLDVEGIIGESDHCIEDEGDCVVCERCMRTDKRSWGGWRRVRDGR